MSLLSEIVIKPNKSPSYLRLVLVLYLLTCGLVFYSGFYLIIKIFLIAFVTRQLCIDWIQQSPCYHIKALRGHGDKWLLELSNGDTLHYDKLNILIHNFLFQLIQLSEGKKNTHLILFNDQLPIEQIRSLHLQAHIS